MHSAPSVNYPVGPSRRVAAALMAVWMAGASAAVAWRRQVDTNLEAGDWRQWLLMTALVVAALGLLVASRAQPVGELRWDGQHWLLEGTRGPGGATASVHFDAQALMLVRLAPADGPAQWLWLERVRAPDRWRALRRALYSRAPPPESPHDVAVDPSARSGRTHPDAIP